MWIFVLLKDLVFPDYLLEIIVLHDWLLAGFEASNFSHTIRSIKIYRYQFNPSRSSPHMTISALFEGEPESPAQGPETPDYPDTLALRSDTLSSKNLVYIPRVAGKT